MHVFSEVLGQEIWRLVDNHVINSTLHWTEQVMVEVRYVNRLVDYQVICLPRGGMVIGKCTTYSIILCGTQGRIVSLDAHRSKIVM
jgi:hypothetical protein